jgi:hypothetical protein
MSTPNSFDSDRNKTNVNLGLLGTVELEVTPPKKMAMKWKWFARNRFGLYITEKRYSSKEDFAKNCALDILIQRVDGTDAMMCENEN